MKKIWITTAALLICHSVIAGPADAAAGAILQAAYCPAKTACKGDTSCISQLDKALGDANTKIPDCTPPVTTSPAN